MAQTATLHTRIKRLCLCAAVLACVHMMCNFCFVLVFSTVCVLFATFAHELGGCSDCTQQVSSFNPHIAPLSAWRFEASSSSNRFTRFTYVQCTYKNACHLIHLFCAESATARLTLGADDDDDALLLVLNVIFKPDNMRVNGARTEDHTNARLKRAAVRLPWLHMIQVLHVLVMLYINTIIAFNAHIIILNASCAYNLRIMC